MSAAEVMHRYVDAASRGDFEAACELYAEDIVFRIPGRSAYAGVYRGRGKAIEYIETARALSPEADVELEVIDSLTSDDRFALIVNERFHRDGRAIDIGRANVYRVSDGKIVEVWIFEADQYTVDELFAAL